MSIAEERPKQRPSEQLRQMHSRLWELLERVEAGFNDGEDVTSRSKDLEEVGLDYVEAAPVLLAFVSEAENRDFRYEISSFKDRLLALLEDSAERADLDEIKETRRAKKRFQEMRGQMQSGTWMQMSPDELAAWEAEYSDLVTRFGTDESLTDYAQAHLEAFQGRAGAEAESAAMTKDLERAYERRTKG